MSYQSQNDAIRGLRRNYPNVGQRTLAQAIVSRDSSVISNFNDRTFIDTHNLTQRTFASVYGVVRRHDSLTKQQAASVVNV